MTEREILNNLDREIAIYGRLQELYEERSALPHWIFDSNWKRIDKEIHDLNTELTALWAVQPECPFN